ncbi:MAG: hypothetical protein IH946_10900 [Bacteroidetes bacterium]|nr:hypothetical protein [Bacteroidota bacterium]
MIKPQGQRQRSNSKPEPVLLLFIVLSNLAILANWYLDYPEEVAYVSTDGIDIPVRKGAVSGHLDRVILKNGHVEFHGWAFDDRNSRLPDTILLRYDGENIYTGKTNVNRDGVVRLYGSKALTAGFKFALPLTVFKDKKINNLKVRFFAVSNGVASELNYFRGFK